MLKTVRKRQYSTNNSTYIINVDGVNAYFQAVIRKAFLDDLKTEVKMITNKVE